MRSGIVLTASLILCTLVVRPAASQIRFSTHGASAGLGDVGESNGAAFGDLDGDGWPDLLVVRADDDEASLLYRNLGGGTFLEGAFEWVAPTESVGGLFVDHDGDGDEDVYIIRHQAANELHVNDGGRLRLAAPPSGFRESGGATGAFFADLDGDGIVELFSTHRFAQPNQWVRAPGLPGMLDLSHWASPLRSGDDVFGATPFDYDGDGDLDVYVCSFIGGNLLQANEGGGRFVPVARQAGLASTRASVAALPGDADGDGRPELYVLNAIGQINELYRRRAGEQIIYDEVAADVGVASEGNSSGGAWADLDNDGDEDLLLSNVAMPPTIYRNDGTAGFVDVSGTAVDVASLPERGTTGIAVADIDRDGDVDVFLTAPRRPDVLLVNESPAQGWVSLDLGHDAALAGTRLLVDDGRRRQVRTFALASSIGTQHGDLLHVGLGADAPDSVSVRLERPGAAALQWRAPTDLPLRLPPAAAAPADLAVRRVLAPGLAPTWEGFRPRVEVVNRGGELSMARQLRVVLRGPGRSWERRQTVAALRPGESVELLFDAWSPDVGGEWLAEIALDGGDVEASNDVWRRTYHFHPFHDRAADLGIDDDGPGWAGAMADYDNDGDLDLYVSNGGSLGAGENVLFRNDRAAGFRDVTAEAGVGDGGNGTGVVFADFDRDGDQDLFIAKGGFSINGEPNRLFRNDGDGAFTDISAGSGLDVTRSSYAAVVGDYDLDGHLDLYVSQLRGQEATFYHNLNGRFEDVTVAKRIQSFFRYSGAAASFSDYDNDGDIDLYAGVFGDFDRFYADVGDTAYAVAEVGGRGDMVGVALGDYDEDGDLDIYTVNQNGRSILYQNHPSLTTFVDVGAESGTENMAQGTGVSFSDFDLDGDLDLWLANAFSGDRLFVNLGNGTFLDQAEAFGVADTARARAILTGDIDNDGDPDAYLINEGRPNRMWVNGGSANGWLTVEARGVTSNPDAVGARLTAWIAGRPHLREVNGTSGMSYSSRTTHFGLGAATTIDSLIVRWPAGGVDRHGPQAAGTTLRVTEGGPLTAVTETAGSAATPDAFRLGAAYPNPFNPQVVLPLYLPAAGPVRLTIYNILGQPVRRLVDGRLPAGEHRIAWDGRDDGGVALASGVYRARLEAGAQRQTQSMVLAR